MRQAFYLILLYNEIMVLAEVAGVGVAIVVVSVAVVGVE